MKGVIFMATVPTQIRIDADVKKQANSLFNELGLDMSGAVNMFLHQCILRGGLPFNVELPKYNEATLEAIEEAIKISRNPDIKGYDTMEELKAALLSE
jgi:DNA-damage-inducible protein J